MCDDVSRICRDAASAQEFDRPFLALRKIAANEGKPMAICADPGWARMGDLGLCTSHCGKPPIRFFGFEPPSAHGYAVGYFAGADSMQFSINNFDKDKAATFTAALERRLLALRALFA